MEAVFRHPIVLGVRWSTQSKTTGEGEATGMEECTGFRALLTENSVAKQKLSTSPSRQATSPKDTPRVAILKRRGNVIPGPFHQ